MLRLIKLIIIVVVVLSSEVECDSGDTYHTGLREKEEDLMRKLSLDQCNETLISEKAVKKRIMIKTMDPDKFYQEKVIREVVDQGVDVDWAQMIVPRSVAVCVTQFYFHYAGSKPSLNKTDFKKQELLYPLKLNNMDPLHLWVCGQDYPPYFMFNFTLTEKLVPERYRSFIGGGRFRSLPDCPANTTDILPSMEEKPPGEDGDSNNNYVWVILVIGSAILVIILVVVIFYLCTHEIEDIEDVDDVETEDELKRTFRENTLRQRQGEDIDLEEEFIGDFEDFSEHFRKEKRTSLGVNLVVM